MEKAIQESKKSSKKLNTNEEAGPSNYQTETQADPSKNTVETSDYPYYYSESDSSIEKNSQYYRGVKDQTSYNEKIGKSFENKNSNYPNYVPELEAHIGTQKKELKLVTDKLSNSDLSKGEHK